MVPRTPQPSLGLFWVDLRGWTAEDFADRPELVRALAAHGSTDLVASSVVDTLRSDVSDGASAFDKLRESMNSDLSDPGLQIPAVIPGSDTEDSIPFPELSDSLFDRDAKRQPSGRIAATDDFRASPEAVTQQPFPSIDSLFGTASASDHSVASPQEPVRPVDPFQSSGKPVFSEEPTSSQTPFTATEESDLITEMLFGGDDVTSTTGTGQSSDEQGEGWGNIVAESRDRLVGDVRSQVASRAGQMADDFRGQVQRTQQQAFDQTLESVEDYSARKLQESLPASVGQFLNSAPAASPTNASSLPPELKALQNGFDPFLK